MLEEIVVISLLVAVSFITGWKVHRAWYRKRVLRLVRVLATAGRDMHLLSIAPQNERADTDRKAGNVFSTAAFVLEHKL